MEAFSTNYSIVEAAVGDAQHVVVTPYSWPDLDGVASAIGLAELLGPRAVARFYETPQFEAVRALELTGISIPSSEVRDDEVFVVVDASHPGDVHASIDLNQIVAVIDHHVYDSPNLFPNVAHPIIESVGACATLISEMFDQKDQPPSQAIGQLLYQAVLSNTVALRARVTTPRDSLVVARFQDLGLGSREMFDQLIQERSEHILRDLLAALDHDTSSRNRFWQGKETAVAELQLADARQLLSMCGRELMEALAALREVRAAQSAVLVIVDYTNFHTYLLSLDVDHHDHVMRILSDIVPFQAIDDQLAVSDRVVLRKEVIAVMEQRGLKTRPEGMERAPSRGR